MAEKARSEAEKKVAVALHYEPGKDNAPRLTAKGHGEMAEKIVAIAEASGVHVERNEPLAHALSRLDFGQQIPKELYRAVAEVVSFVLNKAGQVPKLPQAVSQSAAASEPAPQAEQQPSDTTL